MKMLKIKRLLLVGVLAVLAIFIGGLIAIAGDVPGKINYQARLTDSSGNAITDDIHDLRFTVMDAATAGSAVGSVDTQQNVTTTSAGLVNLQLNFPASSFTGSGARYLKVEVGNGAAGADTVWEELLIGGVGGTRQQLVSVPYAFGGGFVCGTPVQDIQGNTYSTVQIGNQCWMANNYRCTVNANGSAVNGTGAAATTPPAAYTGAGTMEGLLYNWQDAMNGSTTAGAQGICPSGWHIPTDVEWCTLTQYVDATVSCSSTTWSGTDCGTKLKSMIAIASTASNGTNTLGFNGLLTGYRGTDGTFGNRGAYALLWSSAEGAAGAWARYLNSAEARVSRSDYNKANGFSVRCLKD